MVVIRSSINKMFFHKLSKNCKISTFKNAMKLLMIEKHSCKAASYSNKYDFAHDIRFEDVLRAILKVIKKL